MFTPRFHITPEIAAALMQVEAVRRELSGLVIEPQILLPLRETVMLAGDTFLSQWFYAREKTENVGFAINLVCIALGLASYVTFIWGLAEAYDKIKTGL